MATKNMRGAWECTTMRPLGSEFNLRFTTMKRSSGALQTTASVVKLEKSSGGVVWETTRIYHDFHKTLISSTPKRVTAGLIDEQHAKATTDEIVLPLLEEIRAHYLVKGEQVFDQSIQDGSNAPT